MSRSGYTDDCDNPLAIGRWTAQVNSAMRGKRGQAFLRELAEAMDAMQIKELIAEELIDSDGGCCTIGVVCKSRGIDVSEIDYNESEEVGAAVGIARQMAAEIEFYNDEWCPNETPSQRWIRMREWVAKRIIQEAVQ